MNKIKRILFLILFILNGLLFIDQIHSNQGMSNQKKIELAFSTKSLINSIESLNDSFQDNKLLSPLYLGCIVFKLKHIHQIWKNRLENSDEEEESKELQCISSALTLIESAIYFYNTNFFEEKFSDKLDYISYILQSFSAIINLRRLNSN